MIPCTLNPLGTELNRYVPGTVLCNINNGQTANVTFYPGIYYVRAQGGGGGGGNNVYAGNGQGGGSGAGFEGYLRVKKRIIINVTAGVGGAQKASGTATVIGDIWNLGGGLLGSSDGDALIANAGLYTFNASDDWEIVSYTVASNGIAGVRQPGTGSVKSGGDSVLTGDGGGYGHASATSPGAGGGGGYQWNSGGGAGYYGECLICYSRPY